MSIFFKIWSYIHIHNFYFTLTIILKSQSIAHDNQKVKISSKSSQIKVFLSLK